MERELRWGTVYQGSLPSEGGGQWEGYVLSRRLPVELRLGAAGIDGHSLAARDAVLGLPFAGVPPPYTSVPWGSCSLLKHSAREVGQPHQSK